MQRKATGIADRGLQYLDQGKVDAARSDIQSALKYAPDSLNVRMNAVIFYHYLNDFKNASNIINGTTELMIQRCENSMEKLGYFTNVGRLLAAFNQNDRALEMLNKALEIAHSDEYAEAKMSTFKLGFSDEESSQPEIDEIEELLAYTKL